ncbi:hypothetical protein AQUCO_05400008v1 [Aquilegia coerulea]|uniref:DYW domain-containing protein n=1 Tax=Aquilegia coerulea TaxID=218851 RepID=A0A2G5CH75_AQUCA|nr:hypothetical protein AQUCO_05400008v1 [Aquilegia coerulea]
MAISLLSFPAKTLTTTTTPISEFPNNPKTLILEQCKTLNHLKQVHAHLIKSSLVLNPKIAENVLESSAILLPGSMDYALAVFRAIEEPQAAAYNILIRGFTLKQYPEEAVLLFKEMRENDVEPDKFTFACILKVCSRICALKEGEQIHAQIVKFGYGSHGFVQSTLIHLYAKCGKVDVARRVFDELPERGIISWNAMFSGYLKSSHWEEIVILFQEMLESKVGFDEVTLTTVLTACGRLGKLDLGEWIHEYIEAKGLKDNLKLITSLIDMYAKCEKVDTARKLFDKVPRRDVVAWSAMISGYSQSDRCREALNLFHKMQMTKVDPNEVTMVSVLSSCADLGAFETGTWVHSFIKRKRMKLTVTLGTTIMDFYAKCGSIENSLEVFEEMPSKNVLSWNVLIQGLASNGQGRKALEYFSLMREKGIKPSDVTFIGVLSACSHAGLVDEGRDFFVRMSIDYGTEPRIEHYGCMVDILARAGLIEEAYQFIKSMPMEPNAVVWRTLLASCKVHKNIKFGEKSFNHIVKLDPKNSGDYVLMSNIYSSVGKWEDALRARCQMKLQGMKKTPGCSLIEIDGAIHEFFAEDNAHPRSSEIYDAVENMMKRIKSSGYVPNTAEARFDAEEDDKEASVSHHSEKLAIAFGLIRTSPGTTIRISKNLRMCTDCHNATKMISKVFHREIIVRDRNRFHHFKEGSCSCNDYW